MKKRNSQRRKTNFLAFLTLVLALLTVAASLHLVDVWKDRQLADFIQQQHAVLKGKGKVKVREGNIGSTHVLAALPLDQSGQVNQILETELVHQVGKKLGKDKPTGQIRTVVVVSTQKSKTQFSKVQARSIEMAYYKVKGFSVEETQNQLVKTLLLKEDNQLFSLGDLVTDVSACKERFKERLAYLLGEQEVTDAATYLTHFDNLDIAQLEFSYQDSQLYLHLPAQQFPIEKIGLAIRDLYPLLNPSYLSEGDQLMYEQLRQEDIKKLEQKWIALTFDDGPNAETTPQILDILKRYNVKATFFVLGKQVAGKEDILKRMVAEGHEVANHSWSHPNLTKLSPKEIKDEVERTQAVVEATIGQRPKALRAPYGAVNSTVADVAGLPLIAWSVDSKDWESRNAAAVVNEVTTYTEAGSIILLHDIHKSTVEALEPLLQGLTEAGYQSVTTSQLLGDSLSPYRIYFDRAHSRSATSQ